jgi:hypothetical protein
MRILGVAALLPVLLAASSAQSNSAPDSALTALVQTMSRNEAALAKIRTDYFFFSEERSDRTNQHLWLEAIAETTHGPLRRLLAVDGRPLSAEEQRHVDQRVQALAADPSALDAVNRNRTQDQERGEQMLRMPPGMYLYREVSRQGGVMTVAFKPNPAYEPATYEERVLHAVAGTFQIDEPALRMREVDSRLTEVVKFGFGLLGSIQSGEVHLVRIKTSHGDYKPEVLDFKVVGRVLFFHALGREQHLARHGFVLLPENQSLEDAAKTVLAAHE